MNLCRVKGKCVSTIKDDSLKGYSLVVIQMIDSKGNDYGDMIIAVDKIGCSIGEEIIAVIGSNARYGQDRSETVIDAVIVGIIDEVNYE
ncbi:MAG: EutN/CcmL family microcompartment protein [Gudongella sp.]|nr:EutN/CcmL family microcompartment protein [Gudongella sp.]